MRKQRSIDYEQGIDFDSFTESQKEIEKYSAGVAIIKKCRLIKNTNRLPNEYTSKHSLNEDKYLILDAEKNESEITIVVPIYPGGDLDFCYKWTGAKSIDYLAGKSIPVKNLSNEVFRVEKFDDSIYQFLPIYLIKLFIKRKIIYEKIDGSWDIKKTYKYLIFSIIVMLLLLMVNFLSLYINVLISGVISYFVIFKTLEYIGNK